VFAVSSINNHSDGILDALLPHTRLVVDVV
jgi:hypothetical protein